MKIAQNMFPKTALLALVLLPLMAGCAGALRSDTPPPAIYRLEPRGLQDGAGAGGPAGALAVAGPELPPGFAGKAVVLHFDGGRRQDFYAGSEWAGNLDAMIGTFIGEMARASWPQVVVETADTSVPVQYVLRTQVLDFQPEYPAGPDGMPELHVRLRFTLQDTRTQDILSDITLGRRLKPAQNNMTAIAAGLERCLQENIAEALALMTPRLAPPPVAPVPETLSAPAP